MRRAVEIGERDVGRDERLQRLAPLLAVERDRGDAGVGIDDDGATERAGDRARSRWSPTIQGAPRSRTGTHTSSRHRPSGFSDQPSAPASCPGSSRIRPSVTVASTVVVSSAMIVTLAIGAIYDVREEEPRRTPGA